MSFLHLFSWLAQTHIGIAMRDSTWAFAIVEIVHLIGLAAFGGVVLFFDLRLVGFGFTQQPVAQLAGEFLPITIGGIALMFLTGSLLLASGPMRYYYNTPFRIKMLLFFLGVIYHLILQIKLSRQGAESTISRSNLRIAGIFSLLLWSGVGMAGRAIGYF
jgi:hypothetical protein